MTLHSWHSPEDKARYEVLRTDSGATLEGEILEACEATGKVAMKVGDTNVYYCPGPGGIKIVPKGSSQEIWRLG
jgi:hypothetical protein